MKQKMIVAWTKVIAMEVLELDYSELLDCGYILKKDENIFCWLYLIMRKRENSIMLLTF